MPPNRKIRLLLSLLFLVIFTSCSNDPDLLDEDERAWLDANPNLIAAINPTYAPYQYINQQGELDGIFVGFLKLIEERIGYQFQKKMYYNWNDVLLDAKAKKIDVIIEIQETNDRNEYLTFSNPLVSQPHVIVTNNSIPKNKSLTYFNRKKIGVIKGYSVEEYLKKNYPEYQIIPVANDQEAYDRLENNDLDAIISFRAIANYFINQKGYNNLIINKQIPYLNQSSIANLREHYILSNIIDKAIRNISNAEKKEIFESWSYSLIRPIYLKTWFWLCILGLLLAALLLNGFINRLLKTKVKEKTVELQQAKEKAEENSQLKTVFLHNISHEIRTPINAVVGFSDMLEKGQIKKEEQSKFLKVINHSGEQLVRVIDDILEISSLDTQKTKVHLSSTNITELLQELGAIYEVEALNKKLNLILEVAQETNNQNQCIAEIWAITDGSKLRKIISALIDNAVKNTNEGVVTVSCKLKEDKLVFLVADTGKGIPKELLPTIFERFQKSSKNIKDYGVGVGLGLAIAKENVALLGGEITVDSTLEVGTNFTVIIPYNPAKLVKEGSSLDQHISTKIKSILIVEDGKINFIVLKRLLQKCCGDHVKILHAENGKIAVDLVKNYSFDIVFMDIKMPVMDGYEATKRIKQLQPNLPVIAQTAYAAPDDQQKALDAGCIDVITKPIKQEDLISAIANTFIKMDSL